MKSISLVHAVTRCGKALDSSVRHSGQLVYKDLTKSVSSTSLLITVKLHRVGGVGSLIKIKRTVKHSVKCRNESKEGFFRLKYSR